MFNYASEANNIMSMQLVINAAAVRDFNICRRNEWTCIEQLF